MLTLLCYAQPKCPILILLLEQQIPGMAGAPVYMPPSIASYERPHPFPHKKRASTMLTLLCYPQPKCPVWHSP